MTDYVVVLQAILRCQHRYSGAIEGDALNAGITAIKTLQSLGYTYHGGEQWKPPLGDVQHLHQQRDEGVKNMNVMLEVMTNRQDDSGALRDKKLIGKWRVLAQACARNREDAAALAYANCARNLEEAEPLSPQGSEPAGVGDEAIMAALRKAGIEPSQYAAAVHTRWKDGIDIDYPANWLRRFVDALTAPQATSGAVDDARSRFERCVSGMVSKDYAAGYRDALDHVTAALAAPPAEVPGVFTQMGMDEPPLPYVFPPGTEPHCSSHDRFEPDCLDCSDALERQRKAAQEGS